MNKKIIYTLLFFAGLLISGACSDNTYSPELPAPQGTQMAQGTALDPEALFGVWQGASTMGEGNYAFEQNYKIEFLSVADGEAFLSHWYNNGTTDVRESINDLEYTYEFDGDRVVLTPKLSASAQGASTITGVHTGDNHMILYTQSGNLTQKVCEIERTGDPEPNVTGVNRTLPRAGETVVITGRNMQFVDHVWIPTVSGETEIKDFTADSRQIKFTMPSLETAPGFIRCESEGAHMSSYTPAMFCENMIFFSNFSSTGGSSPNYEGTEFENTIGITQSLTENCKAYSITDLPEGHSLTLANAPKVNPDMFLSFFSETPQAWPVDTSLDPSGYLRFSFGDAINRVIENSNGMLTRNTKCADAAIEMDIYVYTDGAPVWNTGFISFRLNKDAQKTTTQSWFAQTAMWDASTQADFSDGWQTFRIPMSTFTITSSEQYSTLGGLANYLVAQKMQSLIKFVNYQLDAMHPAKAVDSFQISIANIRLVPTTVPQSTEE